MNAVINMEEFKSLTFNEKAGLITHYARFREKRPGPQLSNQVFFSLFDFCIEVSFREDGKVQYVRAMKSLQDSHLKVDELFDFHLN